MTAVARDLHATFIFTAVAAVVLTPFGGDACEIALGVAVVCGIAHAIATKRWPLRGTPLTWAFAVFALLWIGSIAWSVNREATLAAVQYFPLRMAAFFVGALLVQRESGWRALALGILAMFVGCTVEAVLQLATGATLLEARTLDHGRLRLDFTHPNDIMFLVVVAPLAIAWLLSLKERVAWARLVAVTLAALTALLVLLSGSKTGILAYAGGVTLFLLATLRWRWLAVAAVAGVVAIAGAYAMNLGHLAERFQSATHPPYDARLVVWSVGLELWKDDPILGGGAGTYHPRYTETLEQLDVPDNWEIYKIPIRHPHGIFMAALVEHGVVGLVVLLAVFGLAGWTLVQVRRRGPPDWRSWLTVGVATSLAVLATAGVTEFWFGRRWVLTVFALLVGICANSRTPEGDGQGGGYLRTFSKNADTASQ